MILDEPTNHADLEAVEQLETKLTHFNGAPILVTNDQRLRQYIHLNTQWSFRVSDNRTSIEVSH